MKDYFPSVLQWQAVYLENPFIYWDEQQSGRLFKMRRRTHIVGIFPNDEKCIYTTLRAPPSLRCGPGSILRATALRNDAFASQNQAPLAGLGLPGHDPWRFRKTNSPELGYYSMMYFFMSSFFWLADKSKKSSWSFPKETPP